MCAIIVAAKELEYGWVQGLDVFADWVGEEDDLNQIQGVRGNDIHRVLCVSSRAK